MPNPNHVAIYTRYSSHGQREQSIEGQLRDCRAFAAREGYTVVQEYIDRAISGRTDDRPAFQKMISDSAKKQFSFIIVWKLDRFARNRYDSAINKAKLKKHGVRVLSATEGISDEPEGIMLEGMLESLAEYYSVNLAKHVNRGIRESILSGTYLGGVPPLGFKVENKKLIADPDTAPLVKLAFTEYANGASKKEILDMLTVKGVRGRTGKLLHISSINGMLKNEKYIGNYTVKGQAVNGGCERILDDDTFKKVQQRLAAAKRAPSASKAKELYLLQGKVFCGLCGSTMVGDCGRSKSGAMYHYYNCYRKKKHRACKKMSEQKGFLEWYVVEQTVQYILLPKRIDYIAERLTKKYADEFSDSKIHELETALRRIEGEINTAVDASIAAPANMRQRFFDKMEVLDTQRIDIENDLASLRITASVQYSKEQIIAWLNLFCDGDPLDPEFQERIIKVFINSVYVYDDKLIVYYNIENCAQVSYMEMLESSAEPEIDPLSPRKGVRISKPTPCHDALS